VEHICKALEIIQSFTISNFFSIYILVPKFAHVMFTSSIMVKDELGITCGICLIPQSRIIYCLLGFHVVTHYQKWSIDTKNNLIWWKLSSIWMKILNDIECNFQIELKRNRMQIGAKMLKIYSWQWCWKKKTMKYDNFFILGLFCYHWSSFRSLGSYLHKVYFF
jgi:hypothetical protein